MPEDEILDGLTVDEESLLSDLTAEPEGATPEAAAEYARTPAPRTLSTPFADKPWYQQFAESAQDSPVLSFAENAGHALLSGGSDEAQAGFITAKPGGDPVSRAKMGPPADELELDPSQKNTYAAGSEQEDIRRTLEAEKQERDAENPVQAALGSLAGGAIQGMATPVASIPKAIGAGAALTGAQLMGEGSGTLEERAGQAAEQVVENPVSSTLAVGAPALGAGAARGLNAVADSLGTKSARNTVATFLGPNQRAAYAENFGQEGLDQLGRDVRARNLHKEPWYNAWKPGFNAETLNKNAADLRTTSNEGMELAENQIIAAGNPQIRVGHIADDLDASADKVSGMWDSDAAKTEADFRRKQAAGIRRERPFEGPRTAEYRSELVRTDPFEGPRTAEAVTPPFGTKGEPRNITVMEAPSSEDWHRFLLDAQKVAPGDPLPPAPTSRSTSLTMEGPDRPPTYVEGPELGSAPVYETKWTEGPELGSAPSETASFSEALENRRFYDKNTDYDSRGGYEGAPMKAQVRRQVAGQLRGAIDEGLEGAVARGEVPAEPVKDWQKHKKDYHVAATVADPSLAKMQSEYGGSMGLKDMAGAGLLQAAGVPGGAAIVGAKAMQGRTAGTIANAQARLSENAGALARGAPAAGGAARQALTPIEQAREENPEGAKTDVEAAANTSLKEDLTNFIQEAAETVGGWFSSLVD